jgi:hypothetical protein
LGAAITGGYATSGQTGPKPKGRRDLALSKLSRVLLEIFDEELPSAGSKALASRQVAR